jgi:AraC-like DNA-binding protein
MNGKYVNKLSGELGRFWRSREPTYGEGGSIRENDGKRGHFTYVSLGEAGGLNTGFETVTPQHRYQFDGMRPQALSKAPVGVFQYTLEGWGELEVDGKTTEITAAHAMSVKVPSKHCYRRAAGCDRWVFFWMVFDHPYVIERLYSKGDLLNQVLEMPPDSAPVKAAVALLKIVWGEKADAFAAEQALYRWMLEMERWVFDQRHPEQPRQTLLDEVRRLTLVYLDEAIPVERVARKFGMSRTHFTHHFMKTTGLQPAAFIREVRLHAAASLLRERNLSVKEVAARTGFSDANHLCKVFRAQFHLSPGAYRHLRTQMPSPAGPVSGPLAIKD